MVAAFVRKIYQHFENVADPRTNRGQNYPLIEMVFVALCGAICDCNAWTDVATFGKAKLAWFRKFLPFEQRVSKLLTCQDFGEGVVVPAGDLHLASQAFLEGMLFKARDSEAP